MFAKLFIVALAVVCAAAGLADRNAREISVVPYAYNHPVTAYSSVPVTSYSSYSAPVTSYSAYGSVPVAYSGSPVAYSAYSSPVVASPYVYGRSYVV